MQNKLKDTSKGNSKIEKPVSDYYRVIDNDLARDNIENDLPEADRRDI